MMSDADMIREALVYANNSDNLYHGPDYSDALVALDRLVAERDEAKRLLREADECWAEQGVAALANEEKP